MGNTASDNGEMNSTVTRVTLPGQKRGKADDYMHLLLVSLSCDGWQYLSHLVVVRDRQLEDWRLSVKVDRSFDGVD